MIIFNSSIPNTQLYVLKIFKTSWLERFEVLLVVSTADFMRPVVIFGAVADIARERLLAEYPDRYESPR